MTEKTKKRIKNAGLIVGAIGGSCASTYLCACLAAVCQPIGISATIGKFCIGTLIAEKVGQRVYSTTETIIEATEATQEAMKNVKVKLDEEDLITEEVEETT